jgi:hypothetical protein
MSKQSNIPIFVLEKYSVRISVATPANLTGFLSFPQSLEGSARIIPRLGHDLFLPNPFQFTLIYNPAIGWYSVSTESVVKQGKETGVCLRVSHVTSSPLAHGASRLLLDMETRSKLASCPCTGSACPVCAGADESYQPYWFHICAVDIPALLSPCSVFRNLKLTAIMAYHHTNFTAWDPVTYTTCFGH